MPARIYSFPKGVAAISTTPPTKPAIAGAGTSMRRGKPDDIGDSSVWSHMRGGGAGRPNEYKNPSQAGNY